MADQRTWPESFASGTALTAMHIRKAGGGAGRLLGFGGPGGWVVTGDDGSELARAKDRLVKSEMTVEAGDRRLTASLPGTLRVKSPKELTVVDDATGQPVLVGSLAFAHVPSSVFRAEEWTLSFGSGSPLTYVHSVEDPRTLGFFDATGAPVLLFGHDPSFDVGETRSTFGILLRFWGAAYTSQDRYLARVDRPTADRVVPPDHVPMLAMLGVWLERTVGSRFSSGTV